MSGYCSRSVAGEIRLHPNATLLRLRFDVRPLFNAGAAGEPPAERDVRLVVNPAPDDDSPRVFELDPKIFALLEGLDDRSPERDMPADLIDSLMDRGIVEAAE